MSISFAFCFPTIKNVKTNETPKTNTICFYFLDNLDFFGPIPQAIPLEDMEQGL